MHMRKKLPGQLRWPQRRRSHGNDAEQVGPWGRPGLRQLEMRYREDTPAEALDVPLDATILEAAQTLGHGSAVTAPDTVLLCLWIVAHASRGFEHALWHKFRWRLPRPADVGDDRLGPTSDMRWLSLVQSRWMRAIRHDGAILT
jgi:hypothetical protein